MITAARTFRKEHKGDLSLPWWNVWLRRSGCIRRKGWLVVYRFGEENGREFVDYLSDNKFCGFWTRRIYDDGQVLDMGCEDVEQRGLTSPPDWSLLIALPGVICWLIAQTSDLVWLGQLGVLLAVPLLLRWFERSAFLMLGINPFFFWWFEKPFARIGMIGSMFPPRPRPRVEEHQA